MCASCWDCPICASGSRKTVSRGTQRPRVFCRLAATESTPLSGGRERHWRNLSRLFGRSPGRPHRPLAFEHCLYDLGHVSRTNASAMARPARGFCLRLRYQALRRCGTGAGTGFGLHGRRQHHGRFRRRWPSGYHDFVLGPQTTNSAILPTSAMGPLRNGPQQPA